jgi:hypothetical protein
MSALAFMPSTTAPDGIPGRLAGQVSYGLSDSNSGVNGHGGETGAAGALRSQGVRQESLVVKPGLGLWRCSQWRLSRRARSKKQAESDVAQASL